LLQFCLRTNIAHRQYETPDPNRAGEVSEGFSQLQLFQKPHNHGFKGASVQSISPFEHQYSRRSLSRQQQPPPKAGKASVSADTLCLSLRSPFLIHFPDAVSQPLWLPVKHRPKDSTFTTLSAGPYVEDQPLAHFSHRQAGKRLFQG
jgi:hypothetical protein